MTSLAVCYEYMLPALSTCAGLDPCSASPAQLLVPLPPTVMQDQAHTRHPTSNLDSCCSKCCQVAPVARMLSCG